MFGIRYLKAPPTTYVLQFKGGALRREGRGLSFFYFTRQQGLLGRPRWLPGERAIAFVGRDSDGINGVYAQDFAPGSDTSKTRRRLGGFDRDRITESFGLSPDGTRLTIAGVDLVQSVVVAENVPRIRKPR